MGEVFSHKFLYMEHNNTMTEELRQALLENDRYTTADGQILKNAVVEAALTLRPDLLKLLLFSPRLRDNFFREVEVGLW